VRGTDDGAVFVWVHDGRPAAVGSVFTIKVGAGRRDLIHEFHSLAAEPLTALWRGDRAWHCAGPGVELKPIPAAAAPAQTAPERLRQIQALAREYSANSIDRQGGRWELRLLAKPLYRYEGTRPEVLDGALFAFAQGTDPEVLLLIEAAAERGSHRWRYGLASFTDLGLQVRHKGVEVWSEPVATVLEGRSGPHVGFRITQQPGDNPDDFDRPGTP
jgi:hypothetical protein